MACWTSLLLQMGNGLIVQNSWTNGLLDMLILPNRSGFSSSPQWVQQLDQWPAGQACSSQLGNGLILQPTMGPAAGPMACWTSGFFQIGERMVIQPIMGPAAGPMACWTSLFFRNWWWLDLPAHYGSSSWTNGLLDKLVFPIWERLNPPARNGSSSWTSGDQWPAGQACSSQLGAVEFSSPLWVQ